jgi:hypothetical protein
MSFNTSNGVKEHTIEYNKYIVSNILILKSSLISSSLSPVFVKFKKLKRRPLPTPPPHSILQKGGGRRGVRGAMHRARCARAFFFNLIKKIARWDFVGKSG